MLFTEEEIEKLRVILLREGVDEPTDGIHSWRCRYPDRYGKCDCLDELMKVIADEV